MEPSFYTLPPAFPRIREKMRTYQTLCNGRSAAVFPIGRSLLGRGIYAVRLGNSRRFSLFVMTAPQQWTANCCFAFWMICFLV